MARESANFFGKDTLCIITGASRGLGQTLAYQLAKKFIEYRSKPNGDFADAKIKMILCSTKNSDQTVAKLSSLNGNIELDQFIGKLEDKTTLELLQKKLSEERTDYDQLIVVHNAGTINNPENLATDYTLDDYDTIDEYFKLNLYSVMMITTMVMDKFRPIANKLFINITSLAAIEAFKGLSLYCVGM